MTDTPKPRLRAIIETVAEACHNANRSYCQSLGDDSQPTWEDAPEWAKESTRQGVMMRVFNPDLPVSANHESWMESRVSDGWVYGDVKDVEAKTHPCIVPYEQLPEEQRKKDDIFVETALSTYEALIKAARAGEKA